MSERLLVREKLALLAYRFQGRFCTAELAQEIREHLNDVFCHYLQKGTFPFNLWQVDHEVEVSIEMDTANIKIPGWIHHWLEKGYFVNEDIAREWAEGSKESPVEVLNIEELWP